VIATPTSPTVAFRIGERANDPLAMYLADVYTISCNLAGLPGLSVPCGFVGDLPVGLQLLGPALGEEPILTVASAYQRATAWHLKHPAV
jgi:aspartyl-tRNA(Asn)/glutamyl-tRNA(Gln) amidotransferase subunit A